MKHTTNNEQSTISYRFTMNQTQTMNNELRTMNQFMQNEPNSQSYQVSKAPTNHANAAILFPTFVYCYFKKSQKLQKMRAFCNFWTLTHLTPSTTKTYITFSHQSTNHPSRITRYKNMQNKPNFTQEFIPASRDSATHLLIYSFTHLCKTNPISNPPAVP